MATKKKITQVKIFFITEKMMNSSPLLEQNINDFLEKNSTYEIIKTETVKNLLLIYYKV